VTRRRRSGWMGDAKSQRWKNYILILMERAAAG
jgi:hypothetical protein